MCFYLLAIVNPYEEFVLLRQSTITNNPLRGIIKPFRGIIQRFRGIIEPLGGIIQSLQLFQGVIPPFGGRSSLFDREGKICMTAPIVKNLHAFLSMKVQTKNSSLETLPRKPCLVIMRIM